MRTYCCLVGRLKRYRYVQVNRAELMAFENPGKPPKHSGRRQQSLAVQGFVNDQVKQFRILHKKLPTLNQFDRWLADHYSDREGTETGHSDCDDVVYLDQRLTWVNSAGNRNTAGISLEGLKRYLTSARTPAPRN